MKSKLNGRDSVTAIKCLGSNINEILCCFLKLDEFVMYPLFNTNMASVPIHYERRIMIHRETDKKDDDHAQIAAPERQCR